MSSITAGLFLVYLAPTGVFSFVASSNISSATVVTLCMFQIVPELFLDFYVTFPRQIPTNIGIFADFQCIGWGRDVRPNPQFPGNSDIFIPIFGGLKAMHLTYWDMSAGADVNNKVWGHRIGDAVKSIWGKAFLTWAFTSFVLVCCLA
jgi:hypothetical protein